jgi:YD repeat-containing protein
MIASFLTWASVLLLWAPQAAPASGDGEQSKRVDTLVRDLGSEEAATREKADRELRKIGRPAENALGRAAESQDAEVSRRAKAILDWLRVHKLDDQGRVLVERDPKGWNVEYSRDQRGNVLKKTWVNPLDQKAEYVRCYVYETRDHRLIQEMDAAGRRKAISYRPNGEVGETHVEEGFLEEVDQVAKMPAPKKPSPPTEK